jgi:nitroimidazol reductase NimA-like FMN-containing flavoprotein (pyridoxamine 5'-phosphate oxidase superfamily)
MRKHKKSISERDVIDEIIHKSQICHLACCLEDQPYVIPISFGYDGKTVFFHTAGAGKKNEIFLKNPQVCLGFESVIKLIIDQDQACSWTFDFQSVIGSGQIKEIKDPKEKIAGLNQIMLHYSGKEWDIPEMEATKTKVWGVELTTLTGKNSPPQRQD